MKANQLFDLHPFTTFSRPVEEAILLGAAAQSLQAFRVLVFGRKNEPLVRMYMMTELSVEK